MPSMQITFDTAHHLCQPIKEAAINALWGGATGLSITLSDDVIEARSRVAPTPIVDPPPSQTGTVDSSAASDVAKVWRHLYSGKFSRMYLKLAAQFCLDHHTNQFSLGELDACAFKKGINGIRAAHRNVGRATTYERVALFDGHWNADRGCKEFSLSPEHRDAILTMAAGDNDL